MSRTKAAALAVALAVLASPPLAAGQTPQERAGALATEGLEALEAGEAEVALGRFQAAWQVFSGDPILLYFMALSYQALGRLEEAGAHYESYLKAGPDPGTADKARRLLADVVEELRRPPEEPAVAKPAEMPPAVAAEPPRPEPQAPEAAAPAPAPPVPASLEPEREPAPPAPRTWDDARTALALVGGLAAALTLAAGFGAFVADGSRQALLEEAEAWTGRDRQAFVAAMERADHARLATYGCVGLGLLTLAGSGYAGYRLFFEDLGAPGPSGGARVSASFTW